MADQELIKLSKNQTDPGAATGKDFKVAVPAVGTDGKGNDLVTLPKAQESPRDVDGKNFPATTAKSEGTSVSIAASVDFTSGLVTPCTVTSKK